LAGHKDSDYARTVKCGLINAGIFRVQGLRMDVRETSGRHHEFYF